MQYPKKELLRNGFLLFELCVSISILFFFWTFIPRILLISADQRVRADLDRIYAIIVFLQRKALIEQQSCSLVFAPEKNSYSGVVSGTLSAGVCFGRIRGLTNSGVSASQSKKSITWPHATVSAHADGSLTPGSLYLTDDKRFIQYALTIDVSSVRALRKYRYDKVWYSID